MLQTESIRFKYENTPAFDIPDFNLKGGDELLIIGKSGSGKTTILNILAGLLRPQHGEVFINGTSLYQFKGHALDKIRGKNIGIIFQKPHILSALSVLENIQLANFFAGKEDHNKIKDTLTELGIFPKRNVKVTELSEGEAQRVSIARALANEPKVILADEPTASLDDENAQIVIRLLQEQAKKSGAILIIVTHDQRIKNHIHNQILIGGGL